MLPNALSAAALALAASCASPPAPPPVTDPDPSGPDSPGVQPGSDQQAVALGVAVDARDAHGAPRLVRAVAPRPAAVAGMTPDRAARDHLAALTPLWMNRTTPADLTTHSVQRMRNGSSIVRLQQRIDGVAIHQGELRVMVSSDGSLAAVSGTMQSKRTRAKFLSNPTAAAERALDAMYGAQRAHPAITEAAEHAGYRALSVAADPALEVKSARARPELFPDDDGQLIPVWSVELIGDRRGLLGKRESVARRYLFADADGHLVREVDLTTSDAFVYRAFAETTGNRRPLDGPLVSLAPHPTGQPDNTRPDFGPYNLVVTEAFNGPRDPWLGTAATTTSGNNVEAYAYHGGRDRTVIRPEVRAGRTLNYTYDFNAEPLATPNQSKAATVNAFFVANWLHDWYYDSGFTEAAGNGQLDNYGRGGFGGDPVVIQAQAGALDGNRDNANMTTPDDGATPLMNMYLWSPSGTASIIGPTTPTSIAIFYNTNHNFSVTGELVLAVDAENGDHSACGPLVDNLRGKIAFVEVEGRCNGADLMENVKAAGAIGVITRIGFGLPALSIDGSLAANLPGLVLGDVEGAELEAHLPTTVTMQLEATIEHDGDFDNGIVAHEWGHYMHLRLASCELRQCIAMSEGWGDFVALHMILREGENRDGTFATGVYALTAGGLIDHGLGDPGYFGIRRYPYSLDRSKNPLSFRHIGVDHPLPTDIPVNSIFLANPNSEVHAAGEVWASMLWEAYNVLLDAHPHEEARRRMSDYIVAGLMLTPPNATYTEGRDAILAAVNALDTDDSLLMAAAFAGRGAGTCAVAPPNTSLDFTGVVESGTLAPRVATSAISLTEDASCDHDDHLDPGESGTVHLTVANNGAVAAEDLTITATSPATGVRFGAAVRVPLLAAQTTIDVEIPISIAASAPVNSPLDITARVDGDLGCSVRTVTAELHTVMGVDDALGIATADRFETSIPAWTATGALATDTWSRIPSGTANHAMFGIDQPVVSDTQLVSPVMQVSPTAPFIVTFAHAHDLEDSFDGGVIELTTDGGTTWRDVITEGVPLGYNTTLTATYGNPLAGRRAFTATNATYPHRNNVTLNFGTRLAGQSVQLRLRIGSDRCCATAGWEIDDVVATGITNTPFPGFVAETATCRAPTALEESRVARTRSAPTTSMANVPAVIVAL